MEKSYNILVIGNGFDLAHGLPTTYNDFLEFAERVTHIFEFLDLKSELDYQHSYLDGWDFDFYIKGMLREAFAKRRIVSDERGEYFEVPGSSLNEVNDLIGDNVWFRYFLARRFEIGENWIDFETEMSSVIQALDATRHMVETGNSIQKTTEKEQVVLTKIRECSNGAITNTYDSTQNIDRYTQYLYDDLKKLTRALEIYLADFVANIDVCKKSPDIESLDIDHVLSFNYTDTFEKKYKSDKKIECDYIHGKVDIHHKIDENNMVLGIDEYLDELRRDVDVEFVAFKKFYQRIYKQELMRVKDWCRKIKQDDELEKYSRKFLLEEQISYELVSENGSDKYSWRAFEKRAESHLENFKSNHKKHKLYFFGHSLDVTDKDILRELIISDNVETTIYYYSKDGRDKSDYERKISNLIKVIGEDELIKRTCGTERTIIFKMQQDMV